MCVCVCVSLCLSVCLFPFHCLSLSLCRSEYGISEWTDWEPSSKLFVQWLVGICWRCSSTVCVKDRCHWAVERQSSLCYWRKEIYRIWNTRGWSLCCGGTIRYSLKLWLPERWWVRSSILTASTGCLAGWWVILDVSGWLGVDAGLAGKGIWLCWTSASMADAESFWVQPRIHC